MMEKLKNIGDGDKSINVTDGSVEFKETLKILEKEYNFVCRESIDKGTFGSVFEIKNRDKDDKLAAKISFASKVSKGDKVIWPSLENEHLVPLLATYYLKSTNTYAFIMKKYEFTLLQQMQDINFRKDARGFRRTVSYLKDVADGLSYLHRRGICHADIKANNILIDETDKASICDFGYAQKPLLLIDNYGVPAMYCPPEAKQITEGRTYVDGFHLDQYTLGILAVEIFTFLSLIRIAGQKDPLKIKWSTDIYPVLFDILQPKRFKVLVGTAHMMSSISSSSVLDILNVIKALICLDPSKRATVFDALKYRLFGGKIKKSQVDEMWIKKVDPEELEKMIGLSAPNPLLTVEDLLEERKSYAICDASEKSLEPDLTTDKSNQQVSPESNAAEFQGKLSDGDMTRPNRCFNWFRSKVSWIRNLFASCRKRKSRK